jgi:hypothetical protein
LAGLIWLEGFGLLTLAGGLAVVRGREVTLGLLVATFDRRCALEEDEDFTTLWLFLLPLLDLLLLLLDFLAIKGSANSINAKANVTIKILTICLLFNVNIMTPPFLWFCVNF